MPMTQQDLDKVKELFSTIGRVGALDFQKRASALMRKLARVGRQEGIVYSTFMIAADEIERMEAVEK